MFSYFKTNVFLKYLFIVFSHIYILVNKFFLGISKRKYERKIILSKTLKQRGILYIFFRHTPPTTNIYGSDNKFRILLVKEEKKLKIIYCFSVFQSLICRQKKLMTI